MSASAQNSPLASHHTQSKSHSPHKALDNLVLPVISDLSTHLLHPHLLYMNALSVPRIHQYTIPSGFPLVTFPA